MLSNNSKGSGTDSTIQFQNFHGLGQLVLAALPPRVRKKLTPRFLIAVAISLATLVYTGLAISAKIAADGRLAVILTALEPISNSNLSVLHDQRTVIVEPRRENSCHDSSANSKTFMLLMVISSPENLERREVIRSAFKDMRQTWENHYYNQASKDRRKTRVFKTLFFLGQTSSQEGISQELQSESDKYGDIIIDDMTEDYLHLTLKTLRMLKWVLHNCADEVEYLVKLDDDVFLHIPRFLDFLIVEGNPKLLAGHRYVDADPDHDPYSKWFTHPTHYSLPKFPVFLSGTCYVLGMTAAKMLFEESKFVPLFHLEDVYLTGMLATNRLNMTLVQSGEYMAGLSPRNPKIRSVKSFDTKIVIHSVNLAELKCWYRFANQSEPIGFSPSKEHC